MNKLKDTISFEDFSKIDIRIGTINKVTDFPKAKNPSYQIEIDFGELGIKKSSAQITNLYSKEELLHKKVCAIINFNVKQIATFMSECLILGIVSQKGVVLLNSTKNIKNGEQVS